MDFKKLRYFLTIAEEGQITKAAQRLHMAQPPLSHQIKVFESELGVQLVEKVGRGIRLTEVGLALRDRGEQIMDLVDMAEKELKELNDGLQGTLSVGCVAAWGTALLPERVARFSKLYPAISFQLWEGTTQKITRLLNAGVIEIGIIPSYLNTADYNSLTLPEDPLIAALPTAWDDRPGTATAELLDFVDKPLIIYRNSRPLQEYFRHNKVQPKIICIHDDGRSMLALANAELGVAFVTRTTTRIAEGMNLSYKEITPPWKITAKVIWMKNRYISKTARNFLATFTEQKL